MLTVHCPGCGACLQAPAEAAGRTIRCALCSRRFVAQLPDDAPRTSHTILTQAAPAPAPRRDELRPGDTLGEYEILSKLGQGGMGTVWRGRHRRLGRPVALKVLSPHLLDDAAAQARFQREVEALGRLGLDHPNLVRAYDAGEIDGVHFLVMELLQGQDLARVLQVRRRLPAGEACGIMVQALAGLQCAHEHGLVHRDIKPSNLMLAQAAVVAPAGGTVTTLEPSTVVKILDLGLAHLRPTALDVDAASITGTHQMLGTPDYMAPEQIETAHQVDIRADLYSIGCTLYHLLSGRPPFVCSAATHKLAGHLFTEPDSLAKLSPELPPGLPGVVAKLMAKKREDRYQTPAEAARALRPFAAARPSGSASFGTAPASYRLAPPANPETPHARARTETLAGPIPVPQPPEPASSRVPLIVGLVLFLTVAVTSVSVALVMLSKKRDDQPQPGSPDTPVVEQPEEKKPEEKKPEEKKPRPADLAADVAEMRRLIEGGGDADGFIRRRGPARLAGWRQAAEEGQPAGRYFVARCEALGVGTPQDERRAVEGYRAAAEGGLNWAWYDLARALETGAGTDPNVEEALRLYEQAAAGGHAAAGQRVADLAHQVGESYYRGATKDGARAEPFYRKAAERGHVEAQFQLGYIHSLGHAGAKKPEEAVRWYRKAAAQGHLIAKNNLGVCHARGDGVAKDPGEAARLYREAAEGGYALAMNNLSYCYEQGAGIPADLEQAVAWCQKAADAGYAPAQPRLPGLWAALGQAYFDGKGKEKNDARAEEWSRKAAEQNHREGQFRLGWILEQGLAGPEKPEEAAQWYQKSADQGHALAANNLGDLYERGRGVEADKFKAFRLYEKAAEGGLPLAMHNVARCYERGVGVARNLDEMVAWYEKAADGGHAPARARLPGAWFELGEALATGKGKEKDVAAALPWLRKSADKGNQHAQFRLGWICTQGEAGDPNHEEAFEWYRKAAAQGHVTALNNLGVAYAKGLGVTEDRKEAFKCYLQAAEKGNVTAMANLASCYEKGEGTDQNREQALAWYRKAADKGNQKAKDALKRLEKPIPPLNSNASTPRK